MHEDRVQSPTSDVVSWTVCATIFHLFYSASATVSDRWALLVAIDSYQDGTLGAVPYAELHCHSNFSFLDGASHPEALAEEAARLGLETLALTDHDGLYGIVRFAEAAEARRAGQEPTLQVMRKRVC